MVFINLSQMIIEGGLNSALIQKKERTITFALFNIFSNIKILEKLLQLAQTQ